MSSLFANVTFFYFKCSLCSPVVHVFFQKITFSVKDFRLFVILSPVKSLEWREKNMLPEQWIENLSFNDLWQFNLINIFF